MNHQNPPIAENYELAGTLTLDGDVQLSTRPAVASDLSYLRVNLYREVKRRAGAVGWHFSGADGLRKLVDCFLTRFSVQILCDKAAPAVIFGFCIHSADVLIYLWLDRKVQGAGIGTAFLEFVKDRYGKTEIIRR